MGVSLSLRCDTDAVESSGMSISSDTVVEDIKGEPFAGDI